MTIGKEVSENIKKSPFGNLYLAYVYRCNVVGKPISETVFDNPSDFGPSTGDETPETDIFKTEIRYKSYSGVTNSKKSLVPNSQFDGKSIFFESKNYNPNLCKLTEILNGGRVDNSDRIIDSQVPPRCMTKLNGRTIPGDIIYGVVKKNKKGGLYFAKWCICSQQFYKAFIHCIFTPEEHDTEEKYDTEESLKKWLISGNRTLTNAYRKRKLAFEHNNEGEFNLDNLINYEYTHMRCEPGAINHVHTYAALVLIMRFGEFPTCDNVPNNMDKCDKMLAWDLPDNFIRDLLVSFAPKLHSDVIEELQLQSEVKIESPEIINLPEINVELMMTKTISIRIVPKPKVKIDRQSTNSSTILKITNKSVGFEAVRDAEPKNNWADAVDDGDLPPLNWGVVEAEHNKIFSRPIATY
ncbi:hypothetical protein OAG24_00070 [bacterium]|nr:hypothetical protein [bacterium]